MIRARPRPKPFIMFNAVRTADMATERELTATVTDHAPIAPVARTAGTASSLAVGAHRVGGIPGMITGTGSIAAVCAWKNPRVPANRSAGTIAID